MEQHENLVQTVSLLGLPACAWSGPRAQPSRTSWPCQLNNHQPLCFNATTINSLAGHCSILFFSSYFTLPPPVHHLHSARRAATGFAGVGVPYWPSAAASVRRDGRRGAVGIGVSRPCGERGLQLRGVHAAGRARGAVVHRLQGGGLRRRGRVAAVLLLAVVLGVGGGGGDGEDRRVGAGRVQGGQHAVGHQAAPGGHLRHALHAPVRARLRRRHRVGVVVLTKVEREGAVHASGGHRALRHRADAAGQDRRRRRQAQAVPVDAVVRLPLRQLQPGRHRPPLRPRRGAARRRGDGGGRAVHPRVHLVVGVLDGDGAPQREPGGARAAAAVRRGPPRVRAQPQAGGLAVHAAGARGDDRALRHRAARGEVVPHRRALARLHPRARARRQVPRRGQVPHPRRAAVLPGAARGGGHAVRAPDGGTAAGVAADRVRGLGGVLVRTPQPRRQHRALQAPPPLGARLPGLHPLQGKDIPHGRLLLPHPHCLMAHPPQHHLRQRRQDRQVPRDRQGPAHLRRHRLPWQGRRAPPGAMQLRGEGEDPARPGQGDRRQGPCHHCRWTSEGPGQGAGGDLGQETVTMQSDT